MLKYVKKLTKHQDPKFKNIVRASRRAERAGILNAVISSSHAGAQTGRKWDFYRSSPGIRPLRDKILPRRPPVLQIINLTTETLT